MLKTIATPRDIAMDVPVTRYPRSDGVDDTAIYSDAGVLEIPHAIPVNILPKYIKCRDGFIAIHSYPINAGTLSIKMPFFRPK
ncbi:hypothetical protein O3M35_008292 [Rhynocoris fuscipes]|uniref:Uncharacterized protein n=1 Tax=Rhynocoris fuscipes TaxID=488301 RepID=A0AAW1D6I7_9HEMI